MRGVTFNCQLSIVNCQLSKTLNPKLSTLNSSLFHPVLDLLHDAKEVAAPYHLYLFFGVAFTEQTACEVDELAG